MSESVLIIGMSGSGKSTSIKTMPHDKTFIINCINKPLPFKGWKSKYKDFNPSDMSGNITCVYEAQRVIGAMKYVNNNRNDIKYLIIDDAQYIMGYEFMERAKEKGFDKFVEIGKNMFDILKFSREMRNDIIVFLFCHSEDISGNGYIKTKMKTIGKMLDEKITVEGMFTVVLHSKARKNFNNQMEYIFSTTTDGSDTAKSPDEMFDAQDIPNDLFYVAQCVKKYNEEE